MTTHFFLSWLALPTAFVLDALLGDPRWLPHPVRWMGWVIERAEPFFRRWVPGELPAGGLFASSLIVGCWGITFLIVREAYALHPLAGFVLETVLLFYCFSAQSLAEAAMEIHTSLEAGKVDQARDQVAMIVSRNVNQYQAGDIARATVETVAENTVDGVMSPLLFAALGGAPLALTYKMINTLDSMVGYRDARYQLFGRVAARIDDLANLVPARLSVLFIALACRWVPDTSARQSLQTAWNEGSHHKSPNAGYPEAAFAGALGVRLNGPNIYHGVLVDKPYIGVNLGTVTLEHIPRTCRLMRASTLIACVVACALFLVLHWS